MARLNQVLAIEKDVKGKHTADFTRVHRTCQEPKFFNGLAKTYTPKDEEGLQLPPEHHPVQARVKEVLDFAAALEADLINVVSMKDVANTTATADVVVDGEAILTSVPATHLLWLDKRLEDWHTFFSKLPELDLGEDWEEDENDPGTYRAKPKMSVKTQKTQTPIVLIEPGPHTKGEAQMVTTDEIVGTWENTKLSAAIPPKQKRELLARTVRLLRAVRFAREQANLVDVEPTEYGTAIMKYLVG